MRRRSPSALPLMSAALLLLMGSALVAATNHSRHGGGQEAKQANARCELCGKPIGAGRAATLESDADHSLHRYACVHCALLAARDWVKGDVTVKASSGRGRGEIQWHRHNGRWQVSPSSAVVLSLPETGNDCQQEHVAFRDESEFRAYARSHALARGEQAIAGADVEGIVNAGRPPIPKEAVCPVSGKAVHPKAQTNWTVYKGTAYYFCCTGCKPRFVSSPESYVGPQASAPKHGAGHGGCSGMQGGSCGGHEGGGCEHSAQSPSRRPSKPTEEHRHST